MQSLTGKVTGGSLTAAEWNQLPQEIQNIITDLGIVLAGGDLDQLGKALAMMIGASTFFNETGAANAYVATTIGTKQPITAYHDGMLIRFRPSNNNTGASTLNVDSVGVKDITREDGSALASGQLITTRDAVVRYDSGADDFFLLEYAVPPQAQAVALRGYIDGLTMSNGTDTLHDIDIAVGICRSDNNSETIEVTSALGKQIDAAWATGGTPGTPTGGFPTGLTLSANTWYHVFVIKHTGTGVIGAGFDTSLTAANLLADATGYANPRRIGSVLTDGSSQIIQFTQVGDEFLWDVPIVEANINGVGLVGTIQTPVVTVPLGVRTRHIGNWSGIESGTAAQNAYVLVQSPDITGVAPGAVASATLSWWTGAANGNVSAAQAITRTNLLSQVAWVGVADANHLLYCTTAGYIDRRGADA